MESALPAAKQGIDDQARTTLGHTPHASDRRGRPKRLIITDQFRSAAHTYKVKLRLLCPLASPCHRTGDTCRARSIGHGDAL